MTGTVTLPIWLFVLIVLFAAVTFASHFLFPSVRWFFRRRAERLVARLNTRLERPIEPFKLARRSDMILRLVYDPEVTRAVAEHAQETGTREDVAFEIAQRYAREIVPAFSALIYFGVAIRLARLLSNALYRIAVISPNSAAMAEIPRDATVIYVMNHRSNMDYVLVTYLAAERQALSYAVGEWARVWPLSSLIRAMGAYFIRRKSRNALYRKVLQRYVQLATVGGVSQAIFPEGGLSLDGAIATPKLGLLKYIIEDLDLEARDVVFVPVALNYDRVLEDRILVAAGQSGERRFNASISVVMLKAIRLLWLRVTGRYHRFGHAAVGYGVPMSLRDHRELAEDPEALANHLVARIADAVPVLPVPLMCHLLLTEGPQDRVALERRVTEVLRLLPSDRVHVPRGQRALIAEHGLRILLRRGLAVEAEGQVSLVPEQRQIAEYYARSIQHFWRDDAGAA
ncbi:1-acyl-sn-glycerol-3-phosphate acyltransferase [Litorisediminicola beolgyonensis]|uniref:Glycerol-3-phosphate acyltransferase n=1 Tax=Litorisediminicola beolgyonensis TaxID=1173614 RepID=A0ABW3ZER5_9RHOB